MCDKSLVYRSCDPYTLCGISSCFRLLSPSHRQVTHALLTRPPLTWPRRASSVRLECVMHAASVHPEPGSNSLNIVYIIRPSGQNTYQSDPLYYFKELLNFFKFKRIFGALFAFVCCSIFKEHFRFPSRGQLDYYITALLSCQALFDTFSKKFFVLRYFSPCLNTA